MTKSPVLWLLVTTVLLLVSPAFGEPLFVGVPNVKISEGGSSRIVEAVAPERAAGLMCVISKDGDRYFWTSRGNVELVLVASGAFLTYLAINGSGVVRVIAPEMKEAASLAGETETKFDYVEHLLLGLKSITYYGKKN